MGHITTRHQGGGHKQHYRVVDFVRNKDGIAAKVERLEYDPNRSAHLALLCYADGERRYIIAAKGLIGRAASGERRRCADQGRQHFAFAQYPGRHHDPLRRDAARAKARRSRVRPAPRCSCWRVKEPTRSCGCAPAKSARCTWIAAPPSARSATKSTIFDSIGKAGAQRWRGIRPTVRGVAMNPVDHPHGGGEGKTGTKRDPVSPWGQFTKGYKTRKNKRTQSMIVRSRHRA